MHFPPQRCLTSSCLAAYWRSRSISPRQRGEQICVADDLQVDKKMTCSSHNLMLTHLQEHSRWTTGMNYPGCCAIAEHLNGNKYFMKKSRTDWGTNWGIIQSKPEGSVRPNLSKQ